MSGALLKSGCGKKKRLKGRGGTRGEAGEAHNEDDEDDEDEDLREQATAKR